MFPSILGKRFDGQYVIFHSGASNLVTPDTNYSDDVFVHDRVNDTTERVSVATGEGQGDDYSRRGAISADGRYVAFFSAASNLVADDTNGFLDVFVRDRLSGITERVSVSSDEIQGNDGSINPAISPDGRYVALRSFASNLVSEDTNNRTDIFVRDRDTGTTERVSVASDESQGDGHSNYPSISADGRQGPSPREAGGPPGRVRLHIPHPLDSLRGKAADPRA